jgi:hypothetical protein
LTPPYLCDGDGNGHSGGTGVMVMVIVMMIKKEDNTLLLAMEGRRMDSMRYAFTCGLR